MLTSVHCGFTLGQKGGSHAEAICLGLTDRRVAGPTGSGARRKSQLCSAASDCDLCQPGGAAGRDRSRTDRKSTRLNSSHVKISYAVFCLKKKKSSNGSSAGNHQDG